jgi:hypothetical protein
MLSTDNHPEYEPLDGTETTANRPAVASSGNANRSLSNNSAPGTSFFGCLTCTPHDFSGNHTPQRPVQPRPPNSVGPVRAAPGPQGGRLTTLAQTSRGSPFPSSSRSSTPQAAQTLASGTPNRASGGRITRSKTVTQRLPVVDSYDPVDSETAWASVGT